MATTVTLGQHYRDALTGWEGVAVARTDWLHGCVRIVLERLDKDGKIASETFDEQRLVEAATGEVPKPTARAGGGRPEAVRPPDPR